MKITSVILVLLPFIGTLGCNFSHTPNSKRKAEAKENYLEYKKEFDPWLVRHFPISLSIEISTRISKKDDVKNDIGFYLYEYDVADSSIQKLKSDLKNKTVAYYEVTDSLLFVINRFETLQTDQDRSIPKITDSTYLDSTLFSELYPVPNFIDYENPTNTNGIWLPIGFELFVLEAKSGNYCKEFDLKENFQMPKGWKNGFSRGIAISEKDKTIIYWGVLW